MASALPSQATARLWAGRPSPGNDRRIGVNGVAAYLAPMATGEIEQAFQELVEDFDILDGWEQRIEYVIDLGKGLPPLPEGDRIEANKVRGCAAQVWLAVERDGDRLTQLAVLLHAAPASSTPSSANTLPGSAR